MRESSFPFKQSSHLHRYEIWHFVDVCAIMSICRRLLQPRAVAQVVGLRLRTIPRSNYLASRLFGSVSAEASVDEPKDTALSTTRNRKRLIVPNREGTAPFPRELDSVVATCTAESYNLKRVLSSLIPIFPGTFKLLEDVVYVKIPLGREYGAVGAEAFVFDDGCFVIWGPQREIAVIYSTFKEQLQEFETGGLKHDDIETESLRFDITSDEPFRAAIESEIIHLRYSGRPEDYKNNVIPAKLAYSNGLAASVKLASVESALDKHIEKLRPIPRDIAAGRKLGVGRSEVLCMIGELLKIRSDLNLHSELMDTPEIYWSEYELEKLYDNMTRVLDIKQRVQVLNKKLDYANELATVLRSHLSEQHNLKLEWMIIILIAVEVLFETLHWLG